MNEELLQLLTKCIYTCVHTSALKKLVMSRPIDKSIRRTEGTLFLKKGEPFLQLESFMKDGKVRHTNLSAEEAPEKLLSMMQNDYRQTNILTDVGSCELLISEKGKITLRGGKQLLSALESRMEDSVTLPSSHDKEKHYLLSDASAFAFLSKLGVCDLGGNIFDKKRSKYRQINRFLEILEDVYPCLPPEGVLCVCDLCCGKSYLTFAVYYYLTQVKGRQVEMYGVDRKEDVMQFCQRTAQELGFSGMHFYAMDIADFKPAVAPHLVISLHACDIATDIVLASAARLDAEVILSTPCCHHEMMRQIGCPSLSFIEEHSILKQKLCDAATDALRAKLLEAVGYTVTAMELIDPEETPKNVLIRAVKANGKKRRSAAAKEKALQEYREAAAFLSVRPTLADLLEENGILKIREAKEETTKWNSVKDFMPFEKPKG